MNIERIRVVLVRPRNPGNVGAAARAMKNMGLRQLVVVSPHRFDVARAEEMAVHAGDLLAARQHADTLVEAVAGCGLVIGTTSRMSAIRRGATSPRALAPTILAAAAVNDVALVFGPENHGLTTEELALCHQVVSIPASAAYPSLNLAQSVLILAYELFVGAGGESAAPDRVRAPSERTEAMYAMLEASLRSIGFLHVDNAAHMMRTLRGILGRAALDDHDVRVFLGMARQIRWAGEQGAHEGTHG
jgi:tRNA/rRNA methyltransferase